MTAGSAGKESACNAGDTGDAGSISGLGRSPREVATTPVFLPGEFHEQRSLVGYSSLGNKELDTTERLTFFFKLKCYYKLMIEMMFILKISSMNIF